MHTHTHTICVVKETEARTHTHTKLVSFSINFKKKSVLIFIAIHFIFVSFVHFIRNYGLSLDFHIYELKYGTNSRREYTNKINWKKKWFYLKLQQQQPQ